MKGHGIGGENGEFPLPEAMIQHVQSFMSGEEAARTTVLSKSWYNAWLTRPVLDLDFHPFFRYGFTSPLFEEFAKKTIQRYQGLSLKIERFRLHVGMDKDRSWAHELIVTAMNIGATDVELDLHSDRFALPKEVLGSQTLLRLSVSNAAVDGHFASCSSLQSLSLDSIHITSDDGFKDIFSCCGSIEELSVTHCFGITLSRENLPKLHKLRRLILQCMILEDTFFTDFASRFPCLKELALLHCPVRTRICIASTSLQTIRIVTIGRSCRAKFDVPNIRKFTYSDSRLPSQLSIEGGSTEWELDISIACDRFPMYAWFLELYKLLTKFRLSRISLSLDLYIGCRERGRPEHEGGIDVVPKPLVLENLTIGTHPSLCCDLLLHLFGICRPKFVAGTGKAGWFGDNTPLTMFPCEILMQKPVLTMFGMFGLKKVNMEVDANWR